MRPYRSKETVGKIGENTLRTWADEVGLVVNGSDDDRAGWDFLLESAPEAGDEQPATPFGHDDAFPLRARIQVKATDKSDGFVDVKLSNWLRLVEDSNPSFFFVTELGGRDSPQRAFLFHVGEACWRNVLERRRRNEVGERKPLHKIRLRLHYDQGIELNPLDRHALLAALADAVGPSGSAYSERKARAIQGIGFENGNARVRFVFPSESGEGGDHPIVQLAELEIGLKPHVSFSRAEVHPERFGIIDESPALVIQEGSILAPPPTPREVVDIEFTAPALGQEVRFPAELFVPGALGATLKAGASPNKLPLRLSTPFLEAVIRWDGGTTIRYRTPDPEAVVPARDLHLLARLIALHAAAAEADADVEMVVIHEARRVVALAGSLPAPAGVTTFADHLRFCDLIDTAWTLFRAFEVDHRARLSTSELVEKAGAVEEFSAFVGGHSGGSLTFGWEPLEGSNGTLLTDHARDLVIALELELGSERLVAAAHLDGELAPDAAKERGFRVDYAGTDHRTVRAAPRDEPQLEARSLTTPTLRSLGRKALIILPSIKLGVGPDPSDS